MSTPPQQGREEKVQGPEKKPTLEQATEKIASQLPDIFVCENERRVFQEDFKLLVRTYVMEPAGLPGFHNTKQRRFDMIASYDYVKRYEAKAKAKEAGRPKLLELAKKDAETSTKEEVDNTEEMMEMMAQNPELSKKLAGDVVSKMMKDMQKK